MNNPVIADLEAQRLLERVDALDTGTAIPIGRALLSTHLFAFEFISLLLVAAIVGALASYPLTALAALGVGLVEAFASFYASNFKEVIVFVLIVPVLMWRSLQTIHIEEDE